MLGKSSLLSVPSRTPFFFLNQGLQVVLMGEAALMQLDLPPPLLWGRIWPFICTGSPFPLLLGAEVPPVSPGEIAFGHTTDSSGFTADPQHHE